MRGEVATMVGCSKEDVKVVVSPYRVCPLGAHIDHQGGSVTAMALDKGVLLGFISSSGDEMFLKSRQFTGDVRFRINDDLSKGCVAGAASSKMKTRVIEATEEGHWGDYARGAVYALRKRGYKIQRGVFGFIDGLRGLHGAGISSSAAVGISFLLALEHANGLNISQSENIQLDRSIENEYLGLRNGILDQSAILLSLSGCLTVIHCKNQSHDLVCPQQHLGEREKGYKLLLAFSGLQHALASNSSYNLRVAECQEAARILLKAAGRDSKQPLLSDVSPEEYQKYKTQLEGVLARRANHFFTECDRVYKGIEAWAVCNLKEFGRLMSESGRSSIENYECGCEPMIQLLDIVQNTPGVFGARFSGAGFRGCCVALVASELAKAAANHIQEMYKQVQPVLAKQLLETGCSILICGTADHASIC